NQKVGLLKLEKKGHAVQVAGSGREALEALEGRWFDLVLMDMQMPDMDGLEATAAIREREKQTGGHVPIVAMTAHAQAEVRERCCRGGMDGYVAKPIRDHELWQEIERVVPPGAEDRGSKTPGGAESPSLRDPRSAILDAQSALERVGGNVELL